MQPGSPESDAPQGADRYYTICPAFDNMKKICYNIKKKAFLERGPFRQSAHLTFIKKNDIIYLESERSLYYLDKEVTYMFAKEDIMARLAKGEDAQSIADEMAKVLNEAVQETKEQDNKTDLRAAINTTATGLVNLLLEYFDIDETCNAEEMAELTDQFLDTVEATLPLIEVLEKYEDKGHPTSVITAKTSDKAISDFLKMFVD